MVFNGQGTHKAWQADASVTPGVSRLTVTVKDHQQDGHLGPVETETWHAVKLGVPQLIKNQGPTKTLLYMRTLTLQRATSALYNNIMSPVVQWYVGWKKSFTSWELLGTYETL